MIALDLGPHSSPFPGSPHGCFRQEDGFFTPKTAAGAGEGTPILDEARPWITGDSSSPRRAAVLGANFDATDPVGFAAKGGRAAAVILEEEPEVRS